MSDNFLRLIAVEPDFVPPPASTGKAVERLHEWLPQADQIAASLSDSIQFVDAGGNWEGVFCPNCGADIESAWGDLLDAASDGTGGFRSLGIVAPCCGTATTLNDLRFGWPVGFSRFAIEIKNPRVSDLGSHRLAEVEVILGTRLREVWAHY